MSQNQVRQSTTKLQAATTVNPIKPTLGERHGDSAYSLVTLFQIVTACCIFFACLRVSPLLAIIGTLIGAPAIIRTGVASEMYRKNRMPFEWPIRIRYFAESVIVVVMTFIVAAIVFALVSIAFGAAWVCMAYAVGARDMLYDIAFIGTTGGMIWGMFGALFAFGIYSAKWKPKAEKRMGGRNSEVEI